MSIRYEIDEKDGTKLLYPDQMALKMSRDDSEMETVFVVAVEINVSAAALEVPNSRPMVIENKFLILHKPLGNVAALDFQYVSGPNFTGTVTLVVKRTDGDSVQNEILSDANFFCPEYTGESEIFHSTIEIARVSLAPLDVEKVRSSKNLIDQVALLNQLVIAGLEKADRSVTSEVSAELLSQHANFTKRENGWQMEMTPGGKDAILTRVDERRIRVVGGGENLTVTSSN